MLEIVRKYSENVRKYSEIVRKYSENIQKLLENLKARDTEERAKNPRASVFSLSIKMRKILGEFACP